MCRVAFKAVNDNRQKAADEKGKILSESLTQIALVRSTFMTEQQLQKFDEAVKETYNIRHVTWRSNLLTSTLTRVLVNILALIVLYLLIGTLQKGSINVEIAGSFIATFYINTSIIHTLGKSLEKYEESQAKLNGLWELMRSYGKQTYPVT